MIFGKRFPNNILTICKWLLYIIIISLIPLVYILGILALNTVINSIFAMPIFMLSMWTLMCTPVVIFLLFLGNIVYLFDKEPVVWFLGFIKEKIKTLKDNIKNQYFM